MWTIGTISSLFAAPLLIQVWFVATQRGPYDASPMLGMTVACAAAVGMISWIPHLIVIHDGYLPTFTHEKNTPFTFWFLVITLSVCAALLALAPAFPLTAGQSFTDDGVTFHRGSRSTPIALWIAAPPIWAASALLFYRIGRGLWRRFHPESPRQSDPALRAIEALVPPLRGRLTLTEVQREERAQRARERRSAREKRPQGSLNLPGLVQVPLYLSTLFLGMILPQILMSAWPPNVRFPLAGLVFLAFGWVWASLRNIGEPEVWLVNAAIGGLFLAAALLMLLLGVGTVLIAAVSALYGIGYATVGVVKWVRTRRHDGRA